MESIQGAPAATFEDCYFARNAQTNDDRGGAPIQLLLSGGSLAGVVFEDNYAPQAGALLAGGLSEDVDAVDVFNCTVRGGVAHASAYGSAGGFFFDVSLDVVVADTVIDGCATYAGAGAISVATGDHLELVNATISRTVAGGADGGGALFVDAAATATVRGSLIDGNRAAVGGGVSAASLAAVVVSDSRLRNTRASGEGGGA